MKRLLGFTALYIAVSLVVASVAWGQDLNCSNFNSQADAQQELRNNPSDPNNLDDNSDGIACETLPDPSDLNPVLPEGALQDQGNKPQKQDQNAELQQPGQNDKPQQPGQNDKPQQPQSELFESGGNLPQPDETISNSGLNLRFPFGPATGILLGSSILLFAGYRYISNR